jgi:hypothetical protein
MIRRLVRMILKRLPEAELYQIEDPRKPRGKRWKLVTLLHTLLLGLMSGKKSLLEVEEMTATLSPLTRRLLGIPRRVSDTTLRTNACQLEPNEVRHALHAVTRAAHRRKALEPDELPFGIVSLDGKDTAIPGCDDHYAQRQSTDEHFVGVLRTVTCTLVSSRAKVVVDALPIPAETNEMGVFAHVFSELLRVYGSLGLFKLVCYDTGACSEENARLVRERGYHYLFQIKGPQPTLLAEAQRLLSGLGAEQAAASSEDVLGGSRRVVRRLYMTEQMKGYYWPHLWTVLRIESETLDASGRRLHYENRYYVSSLPRARLKDAQWLRVVRLRWGVENQSHHTLDTAFEEDDHPWIESDPQGALVIALLRRVALSILALFRSVTQRSEERHATPWKQLMRGLERALFKLQEADLEKLRVRPLPAPA